MGCQRRQGSWHEQMLLRWTVMIVISHCVLADVANIDPIYIDAGNPKGYLDPVTGIQWQADDGRYTTNGTIQEIPSSNWGPYGNLSVVDQTLRFWKSGDSCYEVPVAPGKGRYLIRLSFCYNDYNNQFITLNGERQLPTIGVALEEYFVEAISNFGSNSSSYYTDYVVTVADGAASICLFPLQSTADAVTLSPPFINSLAIIPVDTDLYGPTNDDTVLSNWVRINAGGEAVVPTAANPQGNRTWQADYAPTAGDNWKHLTTDKPITIQSPGPSGYGAPQNVFQTAREAGGSSTGYQFKNIHPVDPNNKFLVVLYFAEIDPTVQPGDRVFQVWCNGKYIQNIDLAASFGRNGTYHALVQNLEVSLTNQTASEYGGTTGIITLLLGNLDGYVSKRFPILSGLEIYEMITPQVLEQDENAFKLRIDCGADQNYTDPFGNKWIADSYVSSGGEANVLSPGTSLRMATTVRYFEPEESSRLNCYTVPVAAGRYILRAYFDYGNWDQDASEEAPTFSIAAEGVALVRIKPGTPGLFESVLVYIEDENAEFCLIANSTEMRPTFISSLEILQVNETAYAVTGYDPSEVVLYTYYRATVGGDTFGDGLSVDVENGMRQWFADNTTLTFQCITECSEPIVTDVDIAGADIEPNYWPASLYQSARSAPVDGTMTFDLEDLIPGADVLIFLHFAELNENLSAGNRVFTVYLNGVQTNVTNVVSGTTFEQIDIMQLVDGAYTALDVYIAYKVLESEEEATSLVQLTLRSVEGSTAGPILSGLEVLGVFGRALSTDATDAFAMNVLKSDLHVQEYLGWNGDPCVPVPWTGVKCVEVSGSNYVSVINLPGSGLDGMIPNDVSALSQLVTLNLSGNSLQGPIPEDFNSMTTLVTIDLSSNNLNGSIPEDIASLPLLKTLYLQDNNLDGQLPSDLNPAPSSLQVDYSNNPYLCGASGLPDCSNVPPSGSSGNSPNLAPPTKTGGGGGGSNMGAIIGGLIAGIVALAVVAVVVILLLRRRQNSAAQLPEDKILATPTSKRQNPYWRSRTGEFEMMNNGVHP